MKQKTLSKLTKSSMLGAALSLALAIPTVANAQYLLNTGDTIGNSSFNSAGNWSSGAAPASGHTYSTQGYLLRSPTTAGTYTFAGDSLTIGGGSGGGVYSQTTANNNALIFKASGITLSVNNLILDGSQIRDGNGDGSWTALNGNIHVTANGGTFVAQDTNYINSAISGSGTISIGNNGSGSAQRVVIFTSGASTFNGNILLSSGVDAAHSRLAFAAGSIMNYTIGVNGVNNGVSGVGTLSLDGTFKFDLTGASTTVGDSWTIVGSGVAATYGTTFAVDGFTKDATLWNASANGVDYQYDTSVGKLMVVPEPSTLALGGLGIAGLLAAVRRKK